MNEEQEVEALVSWWQERVKGVVKDTDGQHTIKPLSSWPNALELKEKIRESVVDGRLSTETAINTLWPRLQRVEPYLRSMSLNKEELRSQPN